MPNNNLAEFGWSFIGYWASDTNSPPRYIYIYLVYHGYLGLLHIGIGIYYLI